MATLWDRDLGPSCMCGSRGADGRGGCSDISSPIEEGPLSLRGCRQPAQPCVTNNRCSRILSPQVLCSLAEALVLWEPSHPASSCLNDRPIKEKPIKPQCKNSVRDGCLPVLFMGEPGLRAGGGRDTPMLRRGDPWERAEAAACRPAFMLRFGALLRKLFPVWG